MKLSTYLKILAHAALLLVIFPALISTRDYLMCGAGIFGLIGWLFFMINMCSKHYQAFHRSLHQENDKFHIALHEKTRQPPKAPPQPMSDSQTKTKGKKK